MKVSVFFNKLIAEGESQSSIARKCGISQSTVNNLLNGGDETPRTSTLRRIAGAYNKPLSFFLEDWSPGALNIDDDFSPVPVSCRTIPVISYVQGGDNKYWEEGGYPVGNGFEKIACPPQISDPHAFAFRVQGSSMVPRYYEGETVVVDTTKQVCNGDDVVVRLRDGRVMVKRYRRTNGTVLLESYNAVDDVIVVSETDISRCFKVVCRL